MKICFKTVRYKNFLSVGNNFLEVSLNAAPKTLIIGKNGAAKSSLLDAIYFALFGRPFRNINKGKLVNSINKKHCLVELEFSIGDHDFLFRRGIDPNILEVYQDGEALDQSSNVRDQQKQIERDILGGLTPSVFRQLVVLGSASYVPFMQLTAAARREVIENLLDIQVFSAMNTILKESVSENKRKKTSNLDAIKSINSYLLMQENQLDEARKGKEAEIEKLEKQLLTEEKRLEELNGFLSSLQVPSISSVDQENIQSIIEKSSTLREYKAKASLKKKDLSSAIDFFSNHDCCPTCHQSILDSFREEQIQKNKEKLEQYEIGLEKLESEQKKNADKIDEYNDAKAKREKAENEYRSMKQTIAVQEEKVKGIKHHISSLQNESKQGVEDSILENIEKLKNDLDVKNEEGKQISIDNQVYSVIASMLKDGGVKAKIINKYIPLINSIINKYLEALDFFVQFTLDEEFNEKIKSRYRDEFEYNSFSEGEKLRIDIAILFTWREIMKMRNTITTNLLLMDEILDRSIDNSGAEEFLKLLNQISEGSNVFVISHRGDQLVDKFDRTIKFDKINNYSICQEL